jgi:hypothetical protein
MLLMKALLAKIHELRCVLFLAAVTMQIAVFWDVV